MQKSKVTLQSMYTVLGYAVFSLAFPRLAVFAAQSRRDRKMRAKNSLSNAVSSQQKNTLKHDYNGVSESSAGRILPCSNIYTQAYRCLNALRSTQRSIRNIMVRSVYTKHTTLLLNTFYNTKRRVFYILTILL